MDVLADDNAGRRVIRELRVVREAERLEESEGTRQVSDGEVDENLGGHGPGYLNSRTEDASVQSNDERAIQPRTGRTKISEKVQMAKDA
jgi:hypothetical protein